METKKNTKKALLISVIIGLLTLVALIIIGNVISIGDKIAGVHPILSYLFYTLVGILFILLVIMPVVRVIITPPFKGIGRKDISHYTPLEMTEYIKDLKKGIKLSKEEERELNSGDNQKIIIKKILTDRYDEMEKVVKKAAVSNFVVTAISQNGSLDFIASITISFRMINDIIKILGKRPSYSQLIKLYILIISTSLVITAIDDIIDDINFGELLGSLGGIAGKALNFIIPSATNGLMNSFVTLRIGYAAIKYLEVGDENFNKKEARIFAMKSARKQLLSVGKEGISEATKKAGKIIKNIIK